MDVRALRILLLITMAILIGGVYSAPAMAAYTPWQEGVIKGLGIGFNMGQMYALAKQGHNISSFNAEVDKYNAWVQQNFGNDQNLMMPKMPVQGYATSPNYVDRGLNYIGSVPLSTGKPIHAVDASFNQTPLVGYYEGRIMDLPAGAWYTTYGDERINPNVPAHYGEYRAPMAV